MIPHCVSFPYSKSRLFAHRKSVRTEKCTIVSFYTIVASLIASSDYAFLTRNKAKVGKHNIIPYWESFPHCQSQLFVHGKLVKTEVCTIASFYAIAESLMAGSICT